MRKPLDIEAIFDIDKKVIKDAEKLYTEYSRKFITDKKTDRYQGLMWMTSLPLLEETELYYNGELISSYALFKAMKDNNVSYRLNAFYFENLIFRIIAFWEYIYQFLNQYLLLELYDIKAKQGLIDIACHTPKFIKEGNGTRIELEPKPEKEQKEIRKQLRERIKLISQSSILNTVYSKYEVKDNIEKLMTLIANNRLEKIKKIRNQIIHQRPAGASFTVNFDEIFNNYTVLINNRGWIDLDDVLKDVQQCIDIIREAIQTIHEIVKLNEYPNRIQNAGKEYFLKQVKCVNCNKSYILPAEMLGENNKFKSVITCPYCVKFGCEVIKEVLSTEIDHGSAYGNYFRALEEKLKEDEKDEEGDEKDNK